MVENPSYASLLASFPGLSKLQIESAVVAARKAFDCGDWSGLPVCERAQQLRRFADALTRRANAITDLIVTEAGCPRSAGTMNVQVRAPLRQAYEVIELFVSLPDFEDNPLPLRERISPHGTFVQSLRRYTPIGVVAAIPAYNFPFYTAFWKVMPALVAGNTVILRPNPLTPLSAMVFAEAAAEAELPPGVLNVVLESGLDGARLLTTHPAVDMVAFTGSTAVGTQVMMQAAPTMKRLQLELGGKSAQIFLPDAAERAVQSAAVVCTAHAGQGCALGTRIFIPQERKADLIGKMADLLRQIRIGPADKPDTQMGPVISAAQRAKCEHYVKLAVENGARVATGGRAPPHLKQGYYFEPTLLDLPDNSNPAAQEEIFGPVVSVIGYRDLDHAVAMANDSRYALSGYVYGEDRGKAVNVALRIRSGTVHVNTGVVSTYASSGGHRASGIGRERGIEGLRLYQELGCLNLGG
jgi:aldehyde dehydrogenase (NAD+)